jgi:hypothetical protein
MRERRAFELGSLKATAMSELLPNTLSPTDLGHSKFEPSQCTKFDCLKITNNSKRTGTASKPYTHESKNPVHGKYQTLCFQTAVGILELLK